MHGWLDWLLGLELISLDASEPMSLRFALPFGAWVIATAATAMVLYVLFVYRRESGNRAGRIVLAGLRCALVLLVLAAICQPVLVLQRSKVDPSYVAVLVDVSSSMSRTNRPRRVRRHGWRAWPCRRATRRRPTK